MYLRTLLIAFAGIFCCTLNLMGENEKKTITLNMIVKDESHVIRRCLDSVKPIIDYWVIVDTGSTDGTQELIKEYMKDIPGELHERPWKNFAHNRNEALELAKNKADYVLIMDADDLLVYSDDFKLAQLDKDSYLLGIQDGGLKYYRKQLVNNNLGWKWTGVLHEYISCPQAKTEDILPGVTYKRVLDGARSKDPQKFQKDVQVLEEGLKEEPNNSRYVFYLAQSYRDGNDYENSIKTYEKRIAMGGWDQEIYWSMIQIGLMKAMLGKPANEITETFMRAYLFRPQRAEAPYYLAYINRTFGNFYTAYYFAKEGLKIPLPKDILFVESWIYDYGLQVEHALSAYWAGQYAQAKELSEKLLSNPNLPDDYRDSTEKNLIWINGKLAELKAQAALKKAA